MFYTSEKEIWPKRYFSEHKFVVMLINHARVSLCIILFFISFYYAFVFLFIYKIFMSKKQFSLKFLFICLCMYLLIYYKLIYLHLIFLYYIFINFQFFLNQIMFSILFVYKLFIQIAMHSGISIDCTCAAA